MNNGNKPLIFVLMPFSNQFDELFENCIELAANDANARAERVDKQLYKNENVLERIRDQIDKSEMLVAVITGNKPNVFYEIGLAHALEKHVVLLTNNAKKIPYDLKHFKALEYKNIDKDLVVELTEQLKWHLLHPTTRDKYYQEFKNKFSEVESFAERLLPFFLPIASRSLSEWSDYIRNVITDGMNMNGRERLEITRLLTFETKKYIIIEQITGNPLKLHSIDWIEFYSNIGSQNDIEKKWILLVEMDKVKSKQKDVKAMWDFFSERNFSTLYCSPSEFHRSSGAKLPEYQVIENFGEFVKKLRLHDQSYTSGKIPNMLKTIIKICDTQERRLIESIIECASPIDKKWINKI